MESKKIVLGIVIVFFGLISGCESTKNSWCVPVGGDKAKVLLKNEEGNYYLIDFEKGINSRKVEKYVIEPAY